jgi:glutamate carboxypeptidase
MAMADDCPPFAGSGRAKRWVDAYLACAKAVEGRAIASERAGGAGDVNYMSDRGVIVLDGLGAVGGAMHTDGEYIFLPSLRARADALALFLEQIDAHKAFQRLASKKKSD